MKLLFSTLFGTGILGLLLLTYFTLQGQGAIKRELRLDKANMAVEKVRFDQSFEKAWDEFDGSEVSAEEQQHMQERVIQTEKKLEEQKKGRMSTQDLGEMKALIGQ